MYNSSSAPDVFVSPDSRKHSRIGIASFVIGLLAVLMICLAILLAFGYGFSMAIQNPNFQVDQKSPIIMALGLLICISPVLSLVGIGVGIGAVVQNNDKKLFGILGLVLNLLIVTVFCLLVVIVMIG